MEERIEKGIEINSFNKTMKDSVRDFFKYGYMSVNEMAIPERDTTMVKNNYDLLIDILSDRKKKTRKEKTIILDKDSQSYEENPFFKLYRYAKQLDLDKWIKIIFFLSNECGWTGSYETIKGIKRISGVYNEREWNALEDKEKTGLYLQGKNILDKKFRKCSLKEILDNDANEREIKDFMNSRRILKKRALEKLTGIPDKSLKNCMSELFQLGIIEEVNGTIKSRNQKNHVYRISDKTLHNLLEREQNVKNIENVKNNLMDALEYFSRTEVLGEIGAFLYNRMVNQEEKHPVFYFKHDYFIHAMNDYNLINLIFVIEKNNTYLDEIYFNEIVYFKEIRIQCIPLEIRVSEKEGSEYIVCYLFDKRQYIFLNMEFIDEIKNYKFTNLSDGKIEQIRTDMERVNCILKNCWGIMPGKGKESGIIGDASQENRVEELKIIISYDQKERYIKNRLEREIRHGSITWNGNGEAELFIRVINKEEVYPWIRSFYTRVRQIICNGKDITDYFYGEVKDIKERCLSSDRSLLADKKDISVIKESVLPVDETGEKEFLNPSNLKLFHGIWGNACKELGSLLMETMICKKKVEKKDFKSVHIKWDDYSAACLSLRDWEVKNKKVEKPYFLYYILPLTVLERRWLATILEHPKIELFLNEDEIRYLKDGLEDRDRRENLLEKNKKRIKELVKTSSCCQENIKEDSPDHVLNSLESCRKEIKRRLKDLGDSTKTKEIEEELRAWIDQFEKIEKLPTDHVVKYYDRYKEVKNQENNKNEMKNRREYFQTILKAIHMKRRILVDYKIGENKNLVSLVVPVRVEYSKRDDIFRFICLEEKRLNDYRDAVYTLNLERIKRVKIVEDHDTFDVLQKDKKRIVKTEYGNIYFNFDLQILDQEKTNFYQQGFEEKKINLAQDCKSDYFDEVKETISQQLKMEKRNVTVSFFDDAVLKDQILTEFSPWKKICKKDGNKYSLTIFYPDSEILDITIRLLSYGNYIKIEGEEKKIDVEEKKESKSRKDKLLADSNINDKKTERLYQDTPWNTNKDERSIKSEFEKRLGNQLEIWKEREQKQERENGLDERDR